MNRLIVTESGTRSAPQDLHAAPLSRGLSSGFSEGAQMLNCIVAIVWQRAMYF